MQAVLKKFNELVVKGLDKELSDVEYVRGKMINTFILIYTLTSFFFLALRLFTGEFGAILINVFLIAQLIIAYVISVKKGHQAGLIYFLCILLVFQVLLLFSAYHVTVFLYFAALPILSALLFNSALKRNLYFFITFLLILFYYHHHNGHANLIMNFLNIIGISYFIISQFVKLIKRDELALKQALKDKEIMIGKLHKRNKELAQFNHITSHDLQEPLKTITTYSSLLLTKQDKQLDKLTKDSVHFMNNAATRMSSLIDELSEHACIGTKSMLGPVDLMQIIATTKEQLSGAIHEKNAQILHDNLPVIIGYEKELLLLFHGLLSNALKFMVEGRTPNIKIELIGDTDFWQFTVQDNGMGIHQEDFNSIFKMFHRLNAKGKLSGNGAGLAHCHKIVELHQGEIWVESVLGEGSIFHFTINKNLSET